MNDKKDFGLVFWIHLAIILLFYSSPFLFSWKVITGTIFLYYLQLLVFKGCVLTKVELESRGERRSFNYYYLAKLGLKMDEKKFIFILDFIVPWAVVALAFLWQAALGHSTVF